MEAHCAVIDELADSHVPVKVICEYCYKNDIAMFQMEEGHSDLSIESYMVDEICGELNNAITEANVKGFTPEMMDALRRWVMDELFSGQVMRS